MERAEGKAIKTLSRMIFKLISETEPLKKSITSAVSTLSRRLIAMEHSVKKLKDDIVTISGRDMDGEYAKMKAELAQLSSQAMSDVANKKKEFEVLKTEIESSLDSKNAQKRSSAAQVVKTLHEADVKARDLKKQVASRGSFTMYIAVFCLVLVVGAGLALQAKLKKWEKKHLL
jgi:Txe/YoeB family toxin of Txe-Axe toxin-antitoxin module